MFCSLKENCAQMNARTPKTSVKWEAFHILVTVPGVFAQPSGCGEVLSATPEYKDLTSTIGNRYMRENEDFEKCTYWIEVGIFMKEGPVTCSKRNDFRRLKELESR
ncbi:hypothetical protein ANCDUO_11606 [Ancylostoma duodenale]|uniref:CUB domain-containing protein n=1 Tax=Ancylostoma duodenale TaxID=51022 RepID=A0A0C2GH45_9BILA|nr:hypothetical protein ANCDUO_11606 [Ancylostoma duodenale]